MNVKGIIGISLLLCLLTAGCSQQERKALPVEGNAVYYWRTAFTLDSTEQAFLDTYHIGRIYCRYFDVVMRESGERKEEREKRKEERGERREREPQPNATISFISKKPDSIEIIPTVFIMEDCMRNPSDSLARRIVNRIVQMNETHDIEGVKEIQIDCDYTARSRKTYYRFLEQVRNEAKNHGLALSTTIRLHQLAMPAPPADYGVLMLYNTGDPNQFDKSNPILDYRDVKPYIHYLKDYPLPLGAAYPVFRWERNIHGVHVGHEADIATILRVKQAVEHERDDLRQLILTYHLESQNIHRYNINNYEEIYHH